VSTLRTIDDAEGLKEELGGGDKHVVLIGSGWIGMEVGATARTLGNEVTILDRGSVPLAGAIGRELGTVFARLHIDHGVNLRTGVQVERIDRSDDGLRVGLLGGDSVAADAVVVAVGATPNVELAEDAELDVDDGVLVDERFTTSDPDVFAAGDIASVPYAGIGRRIRSEHWANAKDTGRASARGMLGLSGVYDDIPYFYTDQFDLGMEYSGYAPLTVGARVVYRGDVEAREFIAFWIADDRVVAGMNVNVWDVNDQVQRLIRKGPGVDLAKLTDPSVPLEDL
jgi:3-phenylpropionate/trans-cinnamate dioxygenase ferredoxin reductase subunit